MKTWVILVGFVAIALVTGGIIFLGKSPDVNGVLLTGINLMIGFGYVAATLEILKTNRVNINLLKSPVISANVGPWEINEKGEAVDVNDIRLSIMNLSKNYAEGLSVRVSAAINSKEYCLDAPYDGSSYICVQPANTLSHRIKMEEAFLKRAGGLTVARMIELANETNLENQFVLKIRISHLDGFGVKKQLPDLNWYFDFMKKAWNYKS